MALFVENKILLANKDGSTLNTSGLNDTHLLSFEPAPFQKRL